MILDNENDNLKVYEWIARYTQTDSLSIVNGDVLITGETPVKSEQET